MMLTGATALLLVIFIDGMGLGLIFPLINSLIVDPSSDFLAAATTEQTRSFLYGMVIGIFMICWFFGAAILGDLSDSIGRKKALMICLLGSFGGYCLASLAVILKSFAFLILGRVIAGFTSGSQPIAQAAIVDLSTLNTKARDIGLVLMASSVGFIIGPMVGGVLSDSHLVSWFTFSTPFTFVAILSLFNAFLLRFSFKETFLKKNKISIKYFRAIQIFVSAFRHHQIRYLSLIFLFFMLGYANFYTYATYFVFKRYGFDTMQTTFFMATFGLGFALGTTVLTQFFTRWFSLKTTIMTCFILTSLLVFLMVVTHRPIYAWIAGGIAAAFILSAYTSFITLFSNHVDQSSQGWVMGITGAMMAFSFGIIGIMGGLLLHQSENIPFMSCIGFFLLATLLFLFQKSNREVGWKS